MSDLLITDELTTIVNAELAFTRIYSRVHERTYFILRAAARRGLLDLTDPFTVELIDDLFHNADTAYDYIDAINELAITLRITGITGVLTGSSLLPPLTRHGVTAPT